MLFHAFCLAMEWSGATSALETLEDFLGALIPMWWAFVFYALILEITHRDIRESEERYALAQKAANIGSWDWDIVRGNLIWSDQTDLIFGFGPGEFAGTYDGFLERIHPEDRRSVTDAVDACVRGDADYAIEHRIVRPDGSVRWVSETGDVTLDKNGKAVRMVGIVQDITDRKYLEEQEREHQTQLEHVLRLSTAGELASGMAHELNQPLTAISAYAQVYKRMVESGNFNSEKICEAVDGITEQALRGGEIIRRMRDFMRKQTPKRIRVDFNNIAREAIELVKARARSIGVVLQLELAEEPLMVFADRIQIQQVIVNLLQNGFDAMGKNGISDRMLIVRTSMSDHNTVEIAVEDKGEGLRDSDTEKVFESFFTTKPEGLGIGLSISRNIIERHQGH
ncbi:MAG: PAS domain-containing protein, partial [Sedimentisphaerales bacterium]|nr:PAS domain-containing protein [Sedimentisphaerales bacterium]